MAVRVTGQSLVPARTVMTPSGPNIPLVLGLAAIVGLVAGISVALLQWRISWPRLKGPISPSTGTRLGPGYEAVGLAGGVASSPLSTASCEADPPLRR